MIDIIAEKKVKNRYEFKIEEINNVLITSKSSNSYSTMYTRKMDSDGNPTRIFVQTYNAEPEEVITKEGKISVICSKCERWNTFDKNDYYYNDNFVYHCNHCDEDYEDTIDEDTLVEVINSIMDENVFFDFELRINFIHIK